MYQNLEQRALPDRLTFTSEPNCYIIPEYGVLYSTSIIPFQTISQIKLDGECRLESVNGTILEGIFKNGQSEEATFIARYPGGWIKGPWSKDSINGKGEIYDKNGILEYEGEIQNGLKSGNGVEYWEEDAFTGTWLESIKHGHFKQNLRGFSLVAEGRYEFGNKVGSWVFTDSQSSETHQYPISKNAQKERIPCFEAHSYNKALTQNDYQRLTNFSQMLSHELVSAWAYYLQTCLFSKSINDILLFPTQVIKDYKGINHDQSHYQRVRLLTKHFQGKLHICYAIQNSQKKLLFPIIKGGHFYLIVIKIVRQQEDYKFFGQVYDSLSGSQQNGEVVREYLIAEMDDKCQQQSILFFKNKIKQMKFEVMQCARQPDAISCGVFVCMFMERFVQREEIQKQIGKKKFQKYRRKMKELLSKSSIEIDQILKEYNSESKIILSQKKIGLVTENDGKDSLSTNKQTVQAHRKQYENQQHASQTLADSNNEVKNSSEQIHGNAKQRTVDNRQNSVRLSNFQIQNQQSLKINKRQDLNMEQKLQQTQHQQMPRILVNQQNSTESLVQSKIQENQNPKKMNQDAFNKSNHGQKQGYMADSIVFDAIKSDMPTVIRQSLEILPETSNISKGEETRQQISLNQNKPQISERQQSNILYFRPFWLKYIHLIVFIFVLCLHGKQIINNIDWTNRLERKSIIITNVIPQSNVNFNKSKNIQLKIQKHIINKFDRSLPKQNEVHKNKKKILQQNSKQTISKRKEKQAKSKTNQLKVDKDSKQVNKNKKLGRRIKKNFSKQQKVHKAKKK